MAMRVLLTIPHVFAPKEGSLYSSQTEGKRTTKQQGLRQATVGNLDRLGRQHWIHASLGKGKAVVTRQLDCDLGVELTIQVYTPAAASLASNLPKRPGLEVIATEIDDFQAVPLLASRRALEQAEAYDVVGYMEDDLLIEDADLFAKIQHLVTRTSEEYAFLPHRCELIPERGDVILSGDPDGGRPDLFWDTGERIDVPWMEGQRSFYRATNPHSGCYFLTRNQAIKVRSHWQDCNWHSNVQLAGPLEQAGSGLLLPVLKIMKPIPQHYRFLMVRHQDELWKRHPFEADQTPGVVIFS